MRTFVNVLKAEQKLVARELKCEWLLCGANNFRRISAIYRA